MTDSRNSRKVRTGVVTSVSGAKTIVVTITERKRHPKYGKMMTSLVLVSQGIETFDDV